MAEDLVVEPLDVIEHVGPGGVSGSVDLAADAFGLKRREEALHCGVVPDIAGPAHRAVDAIVGHQPLELLAGVLAAAIGVMQKGVGLASPPDRHQQRVRDKLRRHLRFHRPADNAAREEIDDGSHVEPALGRPDIDEVGDPFAVGLIGRELPVEHVRRDGSLNCTLFRPDTGIRCLVPAFDGAD